MPKRDDSENDGSMSVSNLAVVLRIAVRLPSRGGQVVTAPPGRSVCRPPLPILSSTPPHHQTSSDIPCGICRSICEKMAMLRPSQVCVATQRNPASSSDDTFLSSSARRNAAAFLTVSSLWSSGHQQQCAPLLIGSGSQSQVFGGWLSCNTDSQQDLAKATSTISCASDMSVLGSHSDNNAPQQDDVTYVAVGIKSMTFSVRDERQLMACVAEAEMGIRVHHDQCLVDMCGGGLSLAPAAGATSILPCLGALLSTSSGGDDKKKACELQPAVSSTMMPPAAPDAEPGNPRSTRNTVPQTAGKTSSKRCTQHHLALVHPFCPLGTLDHWIHKRRKERLFPNAAGEQALESTDLIFSEQELCATLAGIARALKYLHTTRGALHRDVKPQNIFLTRSDDMDSSADSSKQRIEVQAILGDLGLCRSASNVQTACGTPRYMAPEVVSVARPKQATSSSLNKSLYEASADIYSLGITIQSMITGHHTDPLRKMWYMGSQRSSCRAREALKSDASMWFRLPLAWVCCIPACTCRRLHAPFIDLLNAMVHPEPKKRPSAQHIVRHEAVLKHCTTERCYARDVFCAATSQQTVKCGHPKSPVLRVRFALDGQCDVERLPQLCLTSTEYSVLSNTTAATRLAKSPFG